MPRNPFWDDIEDVYRSEYVTVVTDLYAYTGWVKRINYNNGAVLLLDAHVTEPEPEGDRLTSPGAVMLEDYNAILLNSANHTINTVPTDEIQLSRWNAREFRPEDYADYISMVRKSGHLPSFPTVRPVEADEDDDRAKCYECGERIDDILEPSDVGHPVCPKCRQNPLPPVGSRGFVPRSSSSMFEVVSGNKRVFIAKEAGLDTIPVKVKEYDEGEAVEAFVANHIPFPNEESDRDYYTETETAVALDLLLEDYEPHQLGELPRLRRFLMAGE